MAAKCWLWPNRIINKAFSGKLRDEHNEIVNEHVIMRLALEKAQQSLEYVSSYLDKEDSETIVESVDEALEKVNHALGRLKP